MKTIILIELIFFLSFFIMVIIENLLERKRAKTIHFYHDDE